MAQVTVQTTMFQNPITVDEDEVPVLRAQGLLGPAVQPPPEGIRYPVTQVPDQTPQPDAGGQEETSTEGEAKAAAKSKSKENG